MAVVLDSGPVELAQNRGDLRFGSVQSLPNIGWAYPSLFGLHGSAQHTPLSFAKVYAEQPWIAAAVMRLVSWSVRVPLKAYRKTGSDSRERLQPGDHPVADLVATPWERATGTNLTAFLLQQLLVHGNATAALDQGQSGRLRFDALDWRYQQPIQPFPLVISGWDSWQTGDRETFSADMVLHVAWPSPCGPIGVSPLQQLGVTVDMEDAARKYGLNSLKNMARPPSAIELDESYMQREREDRDQIMAQMRQSVTDLHGPNGSQTGAPAILPPGVKWHQVGHTAVEAALIDQRFINREEVAAVYQLAPPLIGDLRHATYSNIEVLRQSAFSDSLMPPLVLIEQAINAQLVRHVLSDPDVFVEFDFAGVLRGDRLKEVQAIREAINTGVLTPNEGRTALNYPKSDKGGADELYLQRNNLSAIAGDEDPDLDVGDLSLSAQRLGLAIANGVLTAEEARRLIGVDGPAPEPTEEPANA